MSVAKKEMVKEEAKETKPPKAKEQKPGNAETHKAVPSSAANKKSEAVKVPALKKPAGYEANRKK
jgi:hypothetical protein